MSSKKENQQISSAVANCFKSPVLLAIAICLSVMLIATFIVVLTSEIGVGFVLALIFLVVSTICAWLLYAGGYSKGKMKNLRLYIAYSKIMNTITLVIVCIIGAVLVAGCVALTLMSDIIVNDVVPALEEEVKPALEEFVSISEELEANSGELEDLFAELPQEIKDTYGIESVEDMIVMVEEVSVYAEMALESWDDIIDFLSTGFLTLTIIVAVIFVVLIVTLSFVSSALKKTSKFIKAFAKDVNTDRKPPYIVSYIGGVLIIIGGLIAFAFDTLIAINGILLGAVVIMFAIFFKQLKEARDVVEEDDEDEEEDEIENIAVVEAADVSEEVAEEAAEEVAEEVAEAEETAETAAE